MAREHNEHVQIVQEGNYERRQKVLEVKPTGRQVFVARFTRFMWLLVTILVALLVFRFGLKLIAANPGSTFVEVMYDITDVFVAPFNGIIQTPTVGEGGVVDVAALFAMVVYTLGAWALITLFRLMFAETRRVQSVTTIERER